MALRLCLWRSPSRNMPTVITQIIKGRKSNTQGSMPCGRTNNTQGHTNNTPVTYKYYTGTYKYYTGTYKYYSGTYKYYSGTCKYYTGICKQYTYCTHQSCKEQDRKPEILRFLRTCALSLLYSLATNLRKTKSYDFYRHKQI